MRAVYENENEFDSGNTDDEYEYVTDLLFYLVKAICALICLIILLRGKPNEGNCELLI